MPPDKLAYPLLAARASHFTNCLRFQLAQRYLPGVNQRAYQPESNKLTGESVGGPQTMDHDA